MGYNSDANNSWPFDKITAQIQTAAETDNEDIETQIVEIAMQCRTYGGAGIF